MESLTLQWLNLAINAVGVSALVLGANRVGRVLKTLEVHDKELDENRQEHSELWKRIWEIRQK